MMQSLIAPGEARSRLRHEALHAPHLLDSDVTSALRGRVLGGHLTARDAQRALFGLSQVGMTRYPALFLTRRVWELRANLTAYDACYVALAERLACPLVTGDARLSRAPGLRCQVKVVG